MAQELTTRVLPLRSNRCDFVRKNANGSNPLHRFQRSHVFDCFVGAAADEYPFRHFIP